MALLVHVDDDALDVRFTGLDRVICLASHVRIPMAEITAASVRPLREMKQTLGWRVGGGYWPNGFATGWFTVKNRKGFRQLWDTYRDPAVLVVETTRERPCRLVLQHEDRDRLAWWINERR
jgi:hypothetical protein